MRQVVVFATYLTILQAAREHSHPMLHEIGHTTLTAAFST